MSAAKHTPRMTAPMLSALRRLAGGNSLRGHVHASTYWALVHRGFIEDADTITAAGRAAIAKATGSAAS
jgi:hypothetical protein